MQDNLKHQWQSAIKVTSEMLDETKRVAENSSFGTEEPDNILRIGLLQTLIQAKRTSERMPKLIVPEWYHTEIHTEILNDSEESVLNQWHLEIAMRDMFRSVWDTVRCVNSLAEIFVNNPALISTRNIYVMQRDLIDKIIDIPYIHLQEKSRQYLEFLSYVSAPRRLSSLILGNIKYFPEKLTIIRSGLIDFLILLSRYRYFCEHIDGDRKAVSELISEVEDLHNDIGELYKDHSDKNLRERLKAVLCGSENLFLELYTRRYHPDEDGTKLSNEELKSWIDVDYSQKLKEGLLQYIDDDFYNFNALGFKTSEMKDWCSRLPTAHHRFSLYVHDLLGNSIHTEQKWTENMLYTSGS